MEFQATILPGTGAAGLIIGDLLPDSPPDYQRSASLAIGGLGNAEFEQLMYGPVTILSSEKRIVEITVREGYEGRTEKGIGIGSTIREVKQAYGENVYEDWEENLITPSTPGWCFETTAWRTPYDPNSRIIHIVVYSITRGKLTKYENANQ